MTALPSQRKAFLAVVAQFAAFGFAVGAMNGAVPALQRQAGVTVSQMGIAFTVNMAAAFGGMALAGYVLARYSPRRVILFAAPAFAATLLVLETAAGMVGLLAGMAIFACATSMMDMSINTELARQEKERGRPIFSFVHGTASLGTAFGAVTGSLVASAAGPIVVGVVASIGLAIGWVMMQQLGTNHPPVRQEARRGGGFSLSPLVLLLGVVLGIDIAGEISALSWSGRMLEDIFPNLAAVSGIGATLYASFQAVPRLFGDKLRRRYPDRKLVLASLVVATCGFLIIGAMPWLPGKLVGFALVGVGTALVVPCGFAIGVSANHPVAAGVTLATLSTIASVPRTIVPLIFGYVSEATSVATGFLTFGTIVLMAVAVMSALPRHQNP